jgi:hypothetical protein
MSSSSWKNFLKITIFSNDLHVINGGKPKIIL